ncbi:similar to Saccharomyces cerevisiae YHR160C PEX18 Peroxin required for targeting of peroxisomal matrix proteins containing PTS2 [Maudiozyma saulgeensis]|uniref:Similar to Saccharomyces cerevisiae YHR160C PEX18 Peroxin required for targeting of peroxisomal matrix proteins containing PTS2 n=1 Tax=Maudiozyma saulgeensis TaxID=1789683 RepID=A0A1X7R9Q7_9SACH|nr:similar to Saccharomyces cerevisiae YHR160C PEX18 Peroxin required for targeting of peroxisomal matrix proteins containing PTS2 [Kazachstania saulgeensis]
MSETSCSVNPLQRFSTLTNNNGNVPRVPYGNESLISSNARNDSTERSFFNGNSAMNSNISPSFMPLPQSRSTTTNDVQNLSYMQTHNNGNREELDLPDLSKVQIHDPMEFSDEYKKFYGNYEATNIQPNHRPTIQRFPQYEMNRSSLQMVESAPIMIRQFQDPQHSVNINDNGYGGTSFPELNDVQIHTIDHELDIIEHGLTRGPSLMNHSQPQSRAAFDGEQIHFKEVAASIVEVVTPETSRSSSPVNSKLNGSKFMQLMKKVSAGSVTLRRDSPELFTPDTDEVVGNEYFPVYDHPK